jgi:hypothetical protein
MSHNPLRIVFDNVVNRSNVMATQIASLPAANLKTDYRTFWRTNNLTSSVITADFPATQRVRLVSLLNTNLTNLGEYRIQGFTGVTQLYDTGWRVAIPAGLTTVLQNARHCVIWLDYLDSVNRIQISLRDPTNPDSFIQATRLIIGDYWSPEVTADLGVQNGYADLSTNSRTESGSLRSQIRPGYHYLQFQLSSLSLEEGVTINHLIRTTGSHKGVFVSLYPQSTNANLEYSNQIYGKLVRLNALNTLYYNTTQISLSVEEL